MEYNYLEQLTTKRDDWFLKVRIVRLWNAYTPQNDQEPIFLEMILLDEKQTPLHAAVRKNMIAKFKHTLQEGSIYTLRNLKVTEANETYKPVKGQMKGWFLLTTILKNLSCPTIEIPMHYFEFGSLKTITDRIGQNRLLTDIVGRLHALGQEEEIYVSGRPTTIRRLEVKLKEDEIVKVTLWTTIAKEFAKALTNQIETSKILALTSTTVKLFKGEVSLSSTSSTRIYINLQIPEFTDFDAGTFKQEEIKEIASQCYANNDPEKRMQRNKCTIREIMAMQWESNEQEKIFTIHATINAIDTTFGWNYVGCETCYRKLIQDENRYYCNSCKKNSDYPTTRYKIQLKVSDDTASTTLTMFDRDAQKLLNTTASDLLAIHSGEKNYMPSKLQNLCDRSLIFEIKLTDHNLKEGSQNYTITRTFVPAANFQQDQIPKATIKQEPISPTTISSDEEKTLETTTKNNPMKLSQDIQKHGTSSKFKSAKKRINQIIDTSSDEEPVLLQSLFSTATKTKKLRKKSITRDHQV